MNPFPHFADLPPATPQQAAQVYAQLHVTGAMIRLDRTESALAIFAEVYILILYWLALRTGYAAWLRDLSEKVAPRWLYVQGVVSYLLLYLTLAIFGLPTAIYRSYVLPHRYGLTNESVWQWQADHWKGLAIDSLTNALVMGLILLIMRWQPKRWPAICVSILIPIVAFNLFISPVMVDPLFNKFTPLSQSQPIYQPIHALAVKAGIGDAAVYVVDKSKQTNETNAYVAGIGPTIRIVIWDTSLKRMTQREVINMIGHEMGHYVEGHLIIGFCIGTLVAYLLMPLFRRFSEFLLKRFGERWHLRPVLHDPAAIALLLLSLDIFSLPLTPVVNTVFRYIEHRADAFSLGLVRDRVGLGELFVALSNEDLDDPNPPLWEKIWFDNHPPLGERIDFALHGQPGE